MSHAARSDSAPVSFTAWFLLGLLALVLALVVRAPASLLHKALPAGAPLSVSAWGGSVWNGQAAWSQGDTRGLLRWQMQGWRLFTGRVVADISNQGAIPLQGQLVAGPGRFELVAVSGELPVALVQPLLPPGWELPGVVQAESLSVSRGGLRSGAWRAAGGRLLWAGGAMQFSLNGMPQQATLPALAMTPRLEGDTLVLALAEAGSGLGLALVRIAADGRVETQLRERLLRYNPAYRSGGGDPDAVVATVRQAD
ncbi:MAG: type II secretion system protein N [Moraxellaceae bacterium]|nr:type II secretion system protein N [Moraxellaceae bacterium]